MTSATVGGYSYDAYGNTTQTSGSSVGTEYQFAGQETDPSGLQYLRARYYDPASGRFLSRDPLGAGNPYAYGNGNPASMVDPGGMEGGPYDGTDAFYTQFYGVSCMDLPDQCHLPKHSQTNVFGPDGVVDGIDVSNQPPPDGIDTSVQGPGEQATLNGSIDPGGPNSELLSEDLTGSNPDHLSDWQKYNIEHDAPPLIGTPGGRLSMMCVNGGGNNSDNPKGFGGGCGAGGCQFNCVDAQCDPSDHCGGSPLSVCSGADNAVNCTNVVLTTQDAIEAAPLACMLGPLVCGAYWTGAGSLILCAYFCLTSAPAP